MAKDDQSKPGYQEPKEAFVSKGDRPEVKISLDTPLSELRVRELSSILGQIIGKNPFEVGKTPLKDFFDKPFPEVVKDFVKESKPELAEKTSKFEKPEKYEKLEKYEKPEKPEKHEKFEKLEKREIKELKAEKIENDGVFDPGKPIGPDPRFEQLIEAVTGLSKQVTQLTNQMEELRKKVSG